MNSIADFEWRFDRVESEHEWACCVWEYGRCWHDAPGRSGRLSARMATVGALCEIDGFPATPWLGLARSVQEQCAQRWRYAPGELEDYEPLVRAKSEMLGAMTEAQWRDWLRKEGVVVFDLGLPPRDARPEWQDEVFGVQRQPSRAELLSRFAAWLDANPQWWHGEGDRRSIARTGGKAGPRDGLRGLALWRVRRALGSARKLGSDKETCDFLTRIFAEDLELQSWFKLSLEPRAEPTRSRLIRSARGWLSRVASPDS